MNECSNCGHQVVVDTYICPVCNTEIESFDETWLALTSAPATDGDVDHQLVPEHWILSETEARNVLREYGIDRAQLPRIKIGDPAIEDLSVREADIVKVIRDSRTADTAEIYRLVTPLDETDDHEDWEPNTGFHDTIYRGRNALNPELARHILNNLGASMPPAQIGACEQISVNRRAKMMEAVQNVHNGVPYTFIEGELGFGKSFFLYWLRDRILPYSAVGIIDLDEDTVFSDNGSIVQAFRSNLETPRSVETDRFANGVDELWATFLHTVERQTVDHLEERGFQLDIDRVIPNVISALRTIVRRLSVPPSLEDQVLDIGEAHLKGDRHRSFSKELPDTDITEENAHEVLTLISELARFNGYRLVLAVDELEKAERTRSHFEAIETFIEMLPDNTCLFVTGTPELLEGGGEDVAMRSTYGPLYQMSSDQCISLDPPTHDDLEKFTDHLLTAEESVASEDTGANLRYSERVADLGGKSSAVDSYLNEVNPATLTFRGYIQYLRRDKSSI